MPEQDAVQAAQAAPASSVESLPMPHAGAAPALACTLVILRRRACKYIKSLLAPTSKDSPQQPGSSLPPSPPGHDGHLMMWHAPLLNPVRAPGAWTSGQLLHRGRSAAPVEPPPTALNVYTQSEVSGTCGAQLSPPVPAVVAYAEVQQISSAAARTGTPVHAPSAARGAASGQLLRSCRPRLGPLRPAPPGPLNLVSSPTAASI